MINENLDGKRGPMEVVSPGFESTDNCQEFSVINIIILFCWGKRLRKVQIGMPFTV